jgi:hypothetical protein
VLKRVWIGLLVLFLSIGTSACATPAPTSTAPATSTPISTLSRYQLAYHLLARYPDYFFCDPDFYPVSREGAEQANALAQFAGIQSNQSEFSAILEQLKLAAKTVYSDSEKLSIYREHKKITLAVSVSPAETGVNFALKVGNNQGKSIHGIISVDGTIEVLGSEASFNTCPICLSIGTLIDTPQGQIPVEELQVGQMVWTQDNQGKRTAAPILKTSRTAVPQNFQIWRLTLDDGRSVTASAGHPSADIRALSEYREGDTLDKAPIKAIEPIVYNRDATYDLLPAGDSGLYWAGGILLMSTLPGY